jgi:hypothetical protein
MSKDNIFGAKGEKSPDDIMSFIMKKCQEPDIDNKKVTYLYLKSYINALIKTYITTKNINYSIACADLCRHIFNIIYNYTHNVRVSIFMIERTIFLFNEYLNVSTSISSIEIHINEIKSYIIHKTVGSININDKLNKPNQLISNDISILQFISEFLKNIFINIYTLEIDDQSNELQDNDNEITEKDPLYSHMEQIMLLLHTVLYRLLYVGLSQQLEILLDEFLNTKFIENLPKSINILRIRLELFLYIEQTQKDILKAKNLTHSLMSQYIDKLEEDETLNEYLDYTQPIKNNFHFIKLRDLVS